jgi:hypothetical protein
VVEWHALVKNVGNVHPRYSRAIADHRAFFVPSATNIRIAAKSTVEAVELMGGSVLAARSCVHLRRGRTTCSDVQSGRVREQDPERRLAR